MLVSEQISCPVFFKVLLCKLKEIEYSNKWQELIKYLSNKYAFTFGIKHLLLTIYISLMLLSFYDHIVYCRTLWQYGIKKIFLMCYARVWYLLTIPLTVYFYRKRPLTITWQLKLYCFQYLLSLTLVKLCNYIKALTK